MHGSHDPLRPGQPIPPCLGRMSRIQTQPSPSIAFKSKIKPSPRLKESQARNLAAFPGWIPAARAGVAVGDEAGWGPFLSPGLWLSSRARPSLGLPLWLTQTEEKHHAEHGEQSGHHDAQEGGELAGRRGSFVRLQRGAATKAVSQQRAPLRQAAAAAASAPTAGHDPRYCFLLLVARTTSAPMANRPLRSPAFPGRAALGTAPIPASLSRAQPRALVRLEVKQKKKSEAPAGFETLPVAGAGKPRWIRLAPV